MRSENGKDVKNDVEELKYLNSFFLHTYKYQICSCTRLLALEGGKGKTDKLIIFSVFTCRLRCISPQ